MELVLNIVLIAFLAGISAAGVVFVLKIRSFFVDLTFRETPDKPSKLDSILCQYVMQAAKIFAVEAKTTLMGKESGIARGEKAIRQAILQDQAGAINPALGAALSAFPKLTKLIAGKEELAQVALNMLAGAAHQGGGPPAGGNHSPGGSSPFSF